MRTKWLFLLLVLCLCLSGCGAGTGDDNTLWVVTELSDSDGMNLQAEIIVERMEEENPGLDIILEVLPADAQDREMRLTQLRTQIMSGYGPDVYLLPTGSELVSNHPWEDDAIPVEPLFTDVQQAIRNGIFLDMSGFYDADGALGKEALNPKVMEAGCFQGNRYVLPLRYNVPVIYTNADLCREYGLSPELFASDFMTVAETVLSMEKGDTAGVGLKFPENVETLGFPADYRTGEIQLMREQIEAFLRLHQLRNQVCAQAIKAVYDAADYHRMEMQFSIRSLPAEMYTMENFEIEYGKWAWPKIGEFYHECFNLLWQYTGYQFHWSTNGMPIYTGFLSDVLETLGVTKITGQTVDIYPLRGLDGTVNASVAYWGAVGSSCDKPDLAYRFLRQFLLEEFQWDIYRPRVNKNGLLWDRKADPQAKRMVERSLPVRTDGCVEYLWDNLQYQVKWSYMSWIRESMDDVALIQRAKITAEDVPYLGWDLDHVYFPISVDEPASLKYAMSLLNEEDGTPTDQDIDALAEKVWQNLYWCIAEG